MDEPIYRVQEQRPCRSTGKFDCHSRKAMRMACDGCQGDGTRWVTVGTLRPPTTDDGMLRPFYVIEESE